ncbi:uncharacterized protein LOC106171722 [Lingula anatina]|uniref:Uncharacterized protein LOC106171722 n=1 Tax=Lingula anatina TaxID=7574 RepID=A0A1S3JCL3_LINAN|nr:uncharacterized protein LOC106171722 [Lingula anatina]|eukprot:XP_013407624.1 uncharacterized protein LOC106171722 [Lingula anatina]
MQEKTLPEKHTVEEETEQLTSNSGVGVSRKKRPVRYCPYCDILINGGKLKRLIQRKHRDIVEVKEALKLPVHLQNKFFNQKRCDGMYKYNLNIIATSTGAELDSNVMMRERIATRPDEVTMCSGCRRDNEVGQLCTTDDLIMQVGYRHYSMRREDKSKRNATRKSVMGEMRELARVFLIFRDLCEENVTTEDMFTRKHLTTLREAIEKLVSMDNGDEKHGLKLNIHAILQRCIKSLKGLYTETMQDLKYEELGNFQQAYLFRSHEMYSSSRYKALSNSFTKARRSEKQVVPEDITKLKNFWEDAQKGVWLPDTEVEKRDPAEQFLFGKYLPAYLNGKGKKFVPVLVPKDVVKAVNHLVKHRKEFGVPEENPYLFATKSPNAHASGWHTVNDICSAEGVTVNATKNRHYLSTVYASLGMSPADQQVFLDHMVPEPETDLTTIQTVEASATETKEIGKNEELQSGKKEIMTFLEGHMPHCLKSLELQEAYKKTRIKIFNERKTMRENVNKKLQRI